MTRTRVRPVLVTGATGRVGRVVVDLLIDAGVPVRALTHRSEAAATLPANVEVVTGDLTVPESLDVVLRGVSAVFLVWTVPAARARAPWRSRPAPAALASSSTPASRSADNAWEMTSGKARTSLGSFSAGLELLLRMPSIDAAS